MMKPNQPVKYIEYEAGGLSELDGHVIVEAPVSLSVNGELWLTFMCTPVDQIPLAIGFLYNENIISTLDEVVDYRLCASGDNVDIWLHRSVSKPASWRRTSGCTGGMTHLDQDQPFTLPEIPLNGYVLQPEAVTDHIDQLFNAQNLYRQSGGVHTSGLSDGKKIYLTAEDVGRHNTLDKLAGLYLVNQLEIPRKLIVTTGRISSEMLQKSARMGCSVVISRTAASSLAITLAEKFGITLIGYTRRNRFNIYANPGRIQMHQSDPISQMQNS